MMEHATTPVRQDDEKRAAAESKRSIRREGKEEDDKKSGSDFVTPPPTKVGGGERMFEKSVFEPFVDLHPGSTTPKKFRQFIINPLRNPNTIVRCILRRDRSGFDQTFLPMFSICFERPADACAHSDHPLVLYAKRTSVNPMAPFVISLDREDYLENRYARGQNYLGKMRAVGPAGKEFLISDNGIDPELLLNPDPIIQDSEYDSDDGVPRYVCRPRCELASIVYQNRERLSVLRRRRNPEMCVAVPAVTSSLAGRPTAAVWSPQKTEDKIINNHKAILSCGSNVLDDKMALLREDNDDFTDLDHQGRTIVSSKKNFKLVAGDDVVRDDSSPFASVLLRMHKIERDEFVVEFKYPLTLIQAFGICLTRFCV